MVTWERLFWGRERKKGDKDISQWFPDRAGSLHGFPFSKVGNNSVCSPQVLVRLERWGYDDDWTMTTFWVLECLGRIADLIQRELVFRLLRVQSPEYSVDVSVSGP